MYHTVSNMWRLCLLPLCTMCYPKLVQTIQKRLSRLKKIMRKKVIYNTHPDSQYVQFSWFYGHFLPNIYFIMHIIVIIWVAFWLYKMEIWCIYVSRIMKIVHCGWAYSPIKQVKQALLLVQTTPARSGRQIA